MLPWLKTAELANNQPLLNSLLDALLQLGCENGGDDPALAQGGKSCERKLRQASFYEQEPRLAVRILKEKCVQ